MCQTPQINVNRSFINHKSTLQEQTQSSKIA